jgi:dTDP-4-amino-4,6-dideoxygalactose transaminase
MIDFFGVKRQYKNLRDEILDATDEVYSTGILLDGAYTQMFENAIARRCDRKHAISVNSGTTGLMFALQAREPNEPKQSRGILIPAISFVATLNATQMVDVYTAICDVDFTGLIDLQSIYEPIRDTIDTVMYVNLFGNTIDYDKFRLSTEFFGNDDMYVIEDAAQSFGASYNGIPSGKMGTVSVLSFDPTKNLNNYGSGGMLLTDDDYLASVFRDFKDNGKPSGHEIAGINSKMSEADCAQMLIKLNYFDAWQKRRAEIAEFYIKTFGDYVDILPTTEGTKHAWSKFAFRTMNRGGLRMFLENKGIPTKVHYERALYDEIVGRHLLDPIMGTQWEAYKFTHECVSLPIYPEMTDAEVEHVAQTVKSFYTL